LVLSLVACGVPPPPQRSSMRYVSVYEDGGGSHVIAAFDAHRTGVRRWRYTSQTALAQAFLAPGAPGVLYVGERISDGMHSMPVTARRCGAIRPRVYRVSPPLALGVIYAGTSGTSPGHRTARPDAEYALNTRDGLLERRSQAKGFLRAVSDDTLYLR